MSRIFQEERSPHSSQSIKTCNRLGAYELSLSLLRWSRWLPNDVSKSWLTKKAHKEKAWKLNCLLIMSRWDSKLKRWPKILRIVTKLLFSQKELIESSFAKSPRWGLVFLWRSLWKKVQETKESRCTSKESWSQYGEKESTNIQVWITQKLFLNGL